MRVMKYDYETANYYYRIYCDKAYRKGRRKTKSALFKIYNKQGKDLNFIKENELIWNSCCSKFPVQRFLNGLVVPFAYVSKGMLEV
jgi:hypothetical protein